jgi:hypothetical protein
VVESPSGFPPPPASFYGIERSAVSTQNSAEEARDLRPET